MKILKQTGLSGEQAYAVFIRDAEAIQEFITKDTYLEKKLNKLGSSSKLIEDYLFNKVIFALGYRQGKRLEMFVPDFIKPVGSSGIIIEVERGKTVDNNMDFIDFWKCHICQDADYLILIVPNNVPRANGKSKSCFSAVVKRLMPLFAKENYTNVKALAVIPY